MPTSNQKPSLRQEMQRLYEQLSRSGDARGTNALQACFFLLTGKCDEPVVQLWDLSGLEKPEKGEPHA